MSNGTKNSKAGTTLASSSLLDAPVWLTKDYLQDCLRKHCTDDQLTVHRMHAKPALGKGENYGGVLTRIEAEFSCNNDNSLKSSQLQKGHYIVKTSFEGDEFARKIMEPYDIFTREMNIYEHVLPKLNKLLHEIGDDEQLFAETLAVDYEKSALVFEDLNVREFIMPKRLDGLDMKITKIALRKLAKMHATSAILNERENGVLECHDRGMFNRHTNNYAPAFVGLFSACSRCVSNWKGYENIAKKMNDLKPMYMELGKRVFDPLKHHINVLAHGDFWTNNLLVKYDPTNGEPLDLIIIDFQYAAWGSPAIDLHYFLNSSLKETLHLHAQDELIQYYYEIFANTLRKLAYKAKVPSLHRFHIQLQEKAFYAVNTSCVVLAVQRNEETDDADFNALMMDDERAINFKNTCYKNAYTQRMIRQLLPVFEKRGLLELDQ